MEPTVKGPGHERIGRIIETDLNIGMCAQGIKHRRGGHADQAVHPIREDLDLDPALRCRQEGRCHIPAALTIPDIKIGENQPLLRLFNHADPDLQCGNIVIYQGCTIHASSPIKSTFVKSSLKFF